jgi:hypothetical protein
MHWLWHRARDVGPLMDPAALFFHRRVRMFYSIHDLLKAHHLLNGFTEADIGAVAAKCHYVRDLSVKGSPYFALAANDRKTGCDRSILKVDRRSAKGRSCRSTPRADCRHSLQVRGGSASTARADIHIAEELSFFLHRRKAAPSP